MRPTEILSEEHEAIRLMLAILWAISEKMEAGEELDIKHLDEALDFMKSFADEYHHRKEEDLLFTELERAGMIKEGGPTEMMVAEHDAGRKHMNDIREAISRLKLGEEGAKKDVVSGIRDYATLLDEHINKEDEVLYPLADTKITPKAEEEMLKEFERIGVEAGGEDKEEEYNNLLEKLADAYLPEYEEGEEDDGDHKCCGEHEGEEGHTCSCDHNH